MDEPKHNHMTRDIKKYGVCPGCDQTYSRMPEPVVVLGGGGFIGSNLAQRLWEDGYEVTQVDLNWEDWRWPENTDWDNEYDIPPERWYARNYDLRGARNAELAVRGAGTVFHLAADMGGVEYFHSDKDFAAAQTNALITNNVVSACVTEGVQRLIYTSSVCAYDVQSMNEGVIMSEDVFNDGDPDARYGAEKRYGAWTVLNAPRPLEGRVALLDTVYGPGQEHEGQRMKFPAAVAVHALETDRTGTLTLFGDGQQERCYLYIDDAVSRLIQLAEKLIAGPYPVFNIGGTQKVTCQEVAEFCLVFLREFYKYSPAAIAYDSTKPSGVLTRHTSQAKFRNEFGPQHETPWQEGFIKFIDWLATVL